MVGIKRWILWCAAVATVISCPARGLALSSVNIPLDSPAYDCLEKLAGLGVITSDVKGLKPFSKAEANRLLLEAEKNLSQLNGAEKEFSRSLMQRVRGLIPREVRLAKGGKRPPMIDGTLMASGRLRYVYLDGAPRSYNRDVRDDAHQSAFGFIGGDLRPLPPMIVHTTGTEGTPLLENNEGVINRRGHNAELRWSMEAYVSDKVAVQIEPLLLHTPDSDEVRLQKGYVKLGGGGLELEIGRDANWFGPGYRGTTTLTNNAQNFDIVKLSSPEPLDVGWVKRTVGDLKYAVVFSRFDETGSGPTLRQPYFLGAKLALKPRPWWELGVNFVRQMYGPGFTGSSDSVLGGGNNDHSNTIAGIDLRFRIPWLRNTELYGEYSGEDNAGGVWPFVESYVAGVYIPRLTSSGRDDLRFEYFWGSVMLYGDGQFPAGYVYRNMTPGHSQGTAAQDFFARYRHWFSARNNLALEYFHTDRGRVGLLPGQSTEYKHAGRAFWNFPLYEQFDCGIMYGVESIRNLDLVGGTNRTNQILKLDVSYRY